MNNKKEADQGKGRRGRSALGTGHVVGPGRVREPGRCRGHCRGPPRRVGVGAQDRGRWDVWVRGDGLGGREVRGQQRGGFVGNTDYSPTHV